MMLRKTIIAHLGDFTESDIQSLMKFHNVNTMKKLADSILTNYHGKFSANMDNPDCSLENYAACNTDAQKDEVARQLITNSENVNAAVRRAMRARNNDLIRRIHRIAQEIQTPAPVVSTQPQLPEIAADCNNHTDLMNEEWSLDNIPAVKIRFLRENRTDCYNLMTLKKWYKDIKNTFSISIPVELPLRELTPEEDINGEGYGAGSTFVTKLPRNNVFIINYNKLIKDLPEGSTTSEFVAIYLGRHRVGNLADSHAESRLHGQKDGENIYYVAKNEKRAISEAISYLIGLHVSKLHKINDITHNILPTVIKNAGISDENIIRNIIKYKNDNDDFVNAIVKSTRKYMRDHKFPFYKQIRDVVDSRNIKSDIPRRILEKFPATDNDYSNIGPNRYRLNEIRPLINKLQEELDAINDFYGLDPLDVIEYIQDEPIENIDIEKIKEYIIELSRLRNYTPEDVNMIISEIIYNTKKVSDEVAIDIIRFMLEKLNFDLNVDTDYDSPIISAVMRGNIDIVNLLLENGANPRDTFGNGLIENPEVLRILLDDGRVDWNLKDDDGYTQIMHAVVPEYTENLRMLLDEPNIDVGILGPNDDNLIDMAIEEDNIEAAQMLLRHPRFRDTLTDADIDYYNTEISNMLHDDTEDQFDFDNWVVLRNLIVSESPDMHMVRDMIVDNHNQYNINLNYSNRDRGHKTLLESAAEGDNVDIVRLLLENGADSSIIHPILPHPSRYSSPLPTSTRVTNPEIMRLLLEAPRPYYAFNKVTLSEMIEYEEFAGINTDLTDNWVVLRNLIVSESPDLDIMRDMIDNHEQYGIDLTINRPYTLLDIADEQAVVTDEGLIDQRNPEIVTLLESYN